MNILGLNIEEFCSASIMRDGRLLAAVAEERFTREKNYSGFPYQSVEYCLKEAGLKIEDIDLVAVANIGSTIEGLIFSYVQRKSRFSVADYVREANEYWYPRLYEHKDIDYWDVFKDKLSLETFPKDFNDYFLSQRTQYKNGDVPRIQSLKRRLVRSYYPQIREDQIQFFPHHPTHAFYGYYVSKFAETKDPVLVITADSWGDFENGMISQFKDGKYEILHTVDNHNLGRLFRNMTLCLGMKPYDHEYKVMGLAPYSPEYLVKSAFEVFASTMDVEGINFVIKQKPTDHYFWFKKRLEGIRFDGVAGGLQRYFEDRIQKWIVNAVNKFGIRKVSFSGGLAMNIKANMIIGQRQEIEDFFVAASPDDHSNCIGVCFFAMSKALEKTQNGYPPIEPVRTMYLGPEADDREIKATIERHKLHEFCKITENVSADFVAERLTKGMVIGRCAGRMEFGARALGNRSILADPRDLRVVHRINKIIKKRDFWMPFAPVVLDTYWEKYLINRNHLYSPFMTIGFETTELGRQSMSAGIHTADFTTRAQMLKREDNPRYYDIVAEFEKRTGVGAILNTSFNLHGYPIVSTGQDAAHVFLNSDLDALLLNNIYIEKTKRN